MSGKQDACISFQSHPTLRRTRPRGEPGVSKKIKTPEGFPTFYKLKKFQTHRNKNILNLLKATSDGFLPKQREIQEANQHSHKVVSLAGFFSHHDTLIEFQAKKNPESLPVIIA